MKQDLSALFFPVEKVPMEELLPGYEYPSGINNAVCVQTPNGEKRIVNFCSNLYELVRNEDVIPVFLNEIGKFVVYLSLEEAWI